MRSYLGCIWGLALCQHHKDASMHSWAAFGHSRTEKIRLTLTCAPNFDIKLLDTVRYKTGRKGPVRAKESQLVATPQITANEKSLYEPLKVGQQTFERTWFCLVYLLKRKSGYGPLVTGDQTFERIRFCLRYLFSRSHVELHP